MKTRPVGNFGDHPEEPVGSDCMCVTGHLAGCRYFQSNAAEAVQTLEKPDRQMLSYHTMKDTKLEDSISSEEEANYMKTPTPERSVEEIRKEVALFFYNANHPEVYMSEEIEKYEKDVDSIMKILTQTLQAERQKQATELMREVYKEVSDEAEDTFGNGAKVVKQVAEKYGIDLNS
jgi:hypothetical protein